MKKLKNANTSHYARHVWKNMSFLFCAFFFGRILCFLPSKLSRLVILRSSSSGGGEGGLVLLHFAADNSLKLKFKIYHYQKTYLRAIFKCRSLRGFQKTTQPNNVYPPPSSTAPLRVFLTLLGRLKENFSGWEGNIFVFRQTGKVLRCSYPEVNS